MLPGGTLLHVNVAVIGAGVAGLACARELRAAGAQVRVFDKARGAGGRTATRRTDAGSFDHGCPALVRGSWLLELAPLGIEHAEFAGREVPVPSMSALCHVLREGLELTSHTRVESVVPGPAGVRLLAEHAVDLGTFDRVAVTAPAPQAAALLADGAPDLADQAGEVPYSSCWTALVAWDEPIPSADDWHREASPGAPVIWAVRESAKPGREPGERWTIQAGAVWTAAHLDAEPQAVAVDLVAALGTTLACGPVRPPDQLSAHRWLYARALEPLREACLFDPASGIGAGGDWCAPDPLPGDPGALQDLPGVPEALHSGRALARALLG
ncbi:unannotated protein [freshwater metagenome]|uniref:Unannotated protein n=1 Tax=freshwater metagenome TaxID=449393 RepID=A0A6J7JL12_9ZZZZ|nr:NAD(P)-binding protein [Actinomycetota bacterium]